MQKFSNFSFNLFLVLFGFFCGNLLPGGSIEFPGSSTGFEEGGWQSFPNQNTAKINLSGEILSMHQQILGYITQALFSAIPGPGFLGLIVLFFAEFINWCGSRVSPQISSKERNSQFVLKAPSSDFPRRNPLKFSYLNSFKIGFLLGIFVDAFKVGS
jgi:hypothetical protein